jgi:poly-gamma-glutamate synthesis protein (capsule biosynthesis protein)
MRRINLLSLLIFALSLTAIIISYSRFRGDRGEDRTSGNESGRTVSEVKIRTDSTVTILLGGDVMLGRNVMQTSLKNNNFSYPFENVRGISKDAAIFFVNLENPVVKDCPQTGSGFKFCTLPQMVEGLIYARINVVDLANNHILNYGSSGLSETEDYLRQEEILATGVGGLAIKQVGGITVGFLGFNLTTSSLNEEELELIKNSDPKVDYLIVGVHWGEEYKAHANSYQKKWAREMVNEGADIIVGHHPHWVQNFECLNYPEDGSVCAGDNSSSECACNGITGKPVYYSLGNLVFDQMWSEETKRGAIIKLEIGNRGIVKEERIDTYMKNVGQPEILRSS